MPAAVGVAVAGILLAWLTYQRRDDQRRVAGRRVRADSPRGAARSSGSTTCSRALYGACCSAFSRVVGWIDRYIVDGVLNVVSAWTLTAGDDLRTMQTGTGAGLRLRRRRRPARAAALDRGGRWHDADFPILSIMTWAPFVSALVIMFFARHRPLLVRWTSLAGAAVSLVASLWVYWAYDRAAAGFQFHEEFAARAVARHLVPARASTASAR